MNRKTLETSVKDKRNETEEHFESKIIQTEIFHLRIPNGNAT